MNKEELINSLKQYKIQLSQVSEAIEESTDENEKFPLLSLQHDLNELINLTEESLKTIAEDANPKETNNGVEVDDEYALFMEEMAKSGAYDNNELGKRSKDNEDGQGSSDSDIEDDLSSLLGMKCGVYHTHAWGGEPSLYNAMVSAVVPRDNEQTFMDLKVSVLFTQPTHAEMLPCPYYLDGKCLFDDDKCRYSHGNEVYLSNLKEAIEPDYENLKVGSRVLVKMKPPPAEDITLKKSTEKYHLWHRGVVRSINIDGHTCIVKLEHGVKSGDKRKSGSDEINVPFEHIFPLNVDASTESDSEDSISDAEYPEQKCGKSAVEPNASEVGPSVAGPVLVGSAVAGPALGQWEKHTRGIGSKLMFAMGYVAGSGLGAEGEGRVLPVQAAGSARGEGLDLALQRTAADQDPHKVERKLKMMQKKEEERQKRAYEREKEMEKRNVFNFLNKAIGDQTKDKTAASSSIKQTTSKDLNIEHFKITEETKRLDREIVKLNSSLGRHSEGSAGHRNIKTQIVEKHKELDALKSKEKVIAKEQLHRKDKQKMTIF